MILDEPTAHLDLNNRLEIMSLLLEMARTTQKSILVATHELDLALQCADRLWLAAFNRPFVSGVPEDLALSGTIEKTFFPSKTGFNLLTGRFSMPPRYPRPVKVSGPDPQRTWAPLRPGKDRFFSS